MLYKKTTIVAEFVGEISGTILQVAIFASALSIAFFLTPAIHELTLMGEWFMMRGFGFAFTVSIVSFVLWAFAILVVKPSSPIVGITVLVIVILIITKTSLINMLQFREYELLIAISSALGLVVIALTAKVVSMIEIDQDEEVEP